MEIKYNVRTGLDSDKEVEFDSKYDSPTHWMDQEPDEDLIEEAYEVYCKKNPNSKFGLKPVAKDFLIANELYDGFLERWRHEPEVETWFDNWAEDVWRDWEINNK